MSLRPEQCPFPPALRLLSWEQLGYSWERIQRILGLVTGLMKFFRSHALFSLTSSPEQRLLLLSGSPSTIMRDNPAIPGESLLLAFPHIILDAILDKLLQPHDPSYFETSPPSSPMIMRAHH